MEGDRAQPSSTTASQPLVPMTKSSTSTPIITLPVAKSKDNPYSKPGIGNCYRCDELGHKSNECRKRIQVNTVDYEEEDDVLIETELEDSDFIEEHGYSITCVVQKVLCNKRFPTPHNDTKFYHLTNIQFHILLLNNQ